MSKIDERSFRHWFGGLATGVTVMTARTPDKKPAGITISSITSVSLEPPLMLYCLERDAHAYPIFRKTKYFAVNILAEGQEYLSRHFADPRHHSVPDNIWEDDKDAARKNCPILRHTLGWMICERYAVHKAGDHDIIVGKTIGLHRKSGNDKPLLYFHSRYRTIQG